ncbi:conserved hypothetical protein [Parafrankia sp. Ea1.12]|uniref:hypothetical protein n=1 Tax=Parafrankia sp. Ea1.12 TaxID=573499 RepID=UPI000DA47636|nr:hypothetical protein [Parafrankia sp. Ea1.12]SQD96265.1 conserved hypothetical protein [Parafrankia sp. Ea1.12]
MLSTIPSLAVAVIAAALSVLTPPRLTPTERARLVIRHAYRAGTGEPVTRADVLDELLAERPPSPMTGTELRSSVSPDVTPDPTPDAPVTFAAAAVRLGVSVATAKRYAAPSSGKLVRQGDGVTRASLEAVAATR